MSSDFTASLFIYLATAVVSVPIAKRLGLGSVLGYLIAGAIVGPFGLSLLDDPEAVLHAAELGVVLMLFLIGLELQPSLLWRLKTDILGMGSMQVVLSALVLAIAGHAVFGLSPEMALAGGLILSLSSTAIVLQTLRERGEADTRFGRGAFAILLFQDLAVLPMLALFPLLATQPLAEAAGHGTGPLAHLPAWAQAAASLGAVAVIIFAGRLGLRPVFRFIAAARLQELMTAFALVLVLGVTLLMQTVGLSPALGAFVAGVVLADSEFRHEIESDIEPFRGLLLGLFFIAIGASIDFALAVSAPALIALLLAGLLVIKGGAILLVARLFRRPTAESAALALVLAQGGEFAFVLLTLARAAGILPADYIGPLVLTVALSMALTPLLFLLAGRVLAGSAGKPAERPDEIENGRPVVLVAGYGRFGQTVARFLSANGYATSVIDHDADQVDLLRGFGRKVNFGDATRLGLLRVAGIEEACLLVIAIDDRDRALALAATAREAFPSLKIIARAYDRRHAYELMAAGVDALERETFEGGLRLGMKALQTLGATMERAERAAAIFRTYDETLLKEMSQHWTGDFAAYQKMIRGRVALEEELLKRDMAALDRLAETAAAPAPPQPVSAGSVAP